MNYKTRMTLQKLIYTNYPEVIHALDMIKTNTDRELLIEWYCATRLIDTSAWRGLE